jgi:DNA polymerase-3 subunit alpha
MQKYMKDLQPAQFEDLIAMNALYRPGPMDYIPDFIKRKQGQMPIEYSFPQMEARLKETYGITVYQEQVMLLSRDLAGFTRGQSDELRKVMGKKIKAKLPALHEKFIAGALKNGYEKENLEKIWSDWEKFASYAFNKSHSTCYAWIAYQTAYLKAHYPAEFIAANLTRNRNDITEVGKFMDECKSMGINVLSPDVNDSDLNFTVNLQGDIRFGLGGIKGVGEGAALAIIDERTKRGKFKNIYDFLERVNLSTCNKKTVESLAFSGAFDGFHELRREQLFVEVEKDGKKEYGFDDNLIMYGNRFQKDKDVNNFSLFGEVEEVQIVKPSLNNSLEWSRLQKLNKEREFVGMYLSSHPLDSYEFELNYLCNCTTAEIKHLEQLHGKTVIIGGLITSVIEKIDKNGMPYGRFTIEDFNGTHEFYIFKDNYMKFRNYLMNDTSIYVSGNVKYKNEGSKYNPVDMSVSEFRIGEINELRKMKQRFLNKLTVNIPLDKITVDLNETLVGAIKSNKGKVELYMRITNELLQGVTLFSRKHSIDMNPEFFKTIKKMTQNGDLESISVNN